VRVKGKADPVPIWRLLGARSRPGVELAERPATPLIGRGEELAALRRCHRKTFGEHAVQLVTVLGEPGVGKSRLVREFATYVDARPELGGLAPGPLPHSATPAASGRWGRSSRPRRASASRMTRGRAQRSSTRR